VIHSRSRAFAVVAAVLAALFTAGFPRVSVVAQGTPADEVTLRIIVVESEDEARRLREELAGGANFVALASARSVDPSAADGGLLGRLSLSSLRPNLRAAINGLPVGALSGIVPVPTGLPSCRSLRPAMGRRGPSRRLASTRWGLAAL